MQINLNLDSVRNKFHVKLRLVVLIAVSIFFLAIFNSITGFLTPIVLVNSGLSELQMGLIYASSSLFGMAFDFILAKYLKSTHYKRMMLYTIIVAALFPLSLLIYPNIILFLMGMLFWGLYSNLWSFAYYDFSAREAKIAFHATSLSLLFIFLDLGDFIGTLVAEPISKINSNIIILLILGAILSLSLACLLFSYFIKGREDEKKEDNVQEHGKLSNILLVAKRLWPLLAFGTILNIIEAVIWTIMPIIERVAPELDKYGGILLSLTILPSFLTNITLQNIPTKHNKKKIAFIAFIVGSLVMALIGFSNSIIMYLILTFIYGTCFAIVYPLLGGAFADYLRESKSYNNEILSSKDLFANFGYVIGPILGTWLLTITQSTKMFTILGIFTAIIGILLLFVTPKIIPFYDKNVNEK